MQLKDNIFIHKKLQLSLDMAPHFPKNKETNVVMGKENIQVKIITINKYFALTYRYFEVYLHS